MNSDNIEFPNPRAAEVIRDFAVTTGFQKVKLSVKAGSSKGDNFAGLIYKVKIEGIKNEKPAEMNVIVKAAPITEDCRDNIPTRDIFMREIFAYTKIFPTYKKIQNSVEIEHSDMYYFPRCYTVHTEMLNEFLVMEDLSFKSYVMHEPKVEPFDFEHASIALKTVARLHGLSYVLQMKNPGLFDEYVDQLPEMLFSLKKSYAAFINYFKTSSDKALQVLEGINGFDTFKRFADDTYNKMGEVVKPQKYATICHGDFWKNNMLFKYQNESKSLPISVIPLDYQIMRYSSPATDIVYILYMCCSTKLRNERYDDILRTYHESLAHYLSHFGINVEDVLPRKALYEEMKRVGSFGLGMAVMGLIFMTTTGEELGDLSSMLNDENHVNEESAGFKLYKERLQDAVKDAIKFGHIY